MTEGRSKPAVLLLWLLAASVLLGAWLRLTGLDSRSISHPEMYVPGIPLPSSISEPAERLTLTQIITGTFSSDTHPPGYYVLMLPWTRIFGTTLEAIRLPSALLGIACIPLLYLLGVLTDRPVAGVLAAALLAASGYHVFWSQVARMFALACFLGLAASVVLLWIVRGARHQAFWMIVYAALILSGLATHVYFWSLFGAHLAWGFVNAWGRPELPGLCRMQLLVLVLGSPLIAFAGYQSGNTVADLSNNVPKFLAEFAAFAFAMPSDASGFFGSAVPFTGWIWWSALRIVILLTALVLLAAGLRDLRRASAKAGAEFNASPEMFSRGAWRIAWLAAGALGSTEIAGFVYASSRVSPDLIHATIRITEMLVPLPLVIAIAAVLLERYWSKLPAPGRWIRLLHSRQALPAVLTIVPFGLLAALAGLRPILNQRGMLLAAPYLLFTISTGLVALRSKAWLAAPIVAFAIAAGSGSYRRMTVDPGDYGAFASALQSQVKPDDIVFLRKAWYTTPILYYLKKDEYRLMGRDYALAAAQNKDSRVWVVLVYDSEPAPEIAAALSEYRPILSLAIAPGRAILYQRQELSLAAAGRSN